MGTRLGAAGAIESAAVNRVAEVWIPTRPTANFTETDPPVRSGYDSQSRTFAAGGMGAVQFVLLSAGLNAVSGPFRKAD